MHGESSSSLNDNPVTVLEILQRGAGGARFRVSLSDGSSFFCSTGLISRFGLAEGMVLEGDTARTFRCALEREQAEARAVDLLSRREHSREELRLKLLKRSFSPPVIRDVLDRMEELGYLNSSRFAEEWVRSRLSRHPEGRKVLFAGLIAHGVSRDEAERVLDTLLDEETLFEAALKAAEKYSRKSAATDAGLTKRLFSLGFDRKTTMKVVDRLKRFL